MPKPTFYNLPLKRKEEMINAAKAELSKAPYQKVSINKLIESMQICTGSFYQYFYDKKDLYFYILSQFTDSLLEESQRTGKKLDLFDPQKSKQGSKIFEETVSKPYYNEIFVSNHNLAPHNIKRDWIFDIVIGQKNMALYDYSYFDSPAIDREVYENKQLIMGMVLAIPMIVTKFVDREKNRERYNQLYTLCLKIIKRGLHN